ncbi:MAG: MATE family efflux transporter [Bacillota bacterium]|nr:MATE family efflux transporter [Bacillota bacterium]
MSNDGAVDLLVIGRFTDSACVSATAIGGQVMQTITGIVLGISTGGTVVIGQFIGADKKEAAGRAVGNLTALFVVIAAGLTVVMILLARPVTYIMQTPEEAVEYTVKYVTICSFGIPFIVGYNGVSGVFSGFGDSRTPLYFVALACAINIG